MTSVWAAARDLPGGAPLSAADVRALSLPAGSAPAGVLPLTTTVAGRLLAGPVRRGEALTDVRLLGPGLLDGYGPGTVVTPVRLGDAATTRLLSSGDRVDVLAATAADDLSERPVPGAARVVAAAVQVVMVPALDPAGAGLEGGLVLLATSARQAAALAQAQTAERLSLVLVHPHIRPRGAAG